jgi:DNA repair exonuclease SbcCD nuclease subunit
MARPSARLLHTADCHLGAPGQGTAAQPAFQRVVDLALEVQADAVVVAGDLFDTVRVADDVVDWTAEQLRRLDCPVVVLPGNHDHGGTESPFHRRAFAERSGATVLQREEGQLVADASPRFAFWGRATHDHSPSFRPLVGVPARPADRWGVVIGHGLLVRDASATDRGSPIDLADLDIEGWDYVALGHVDAFQVVQVEPVTACYAGATSGTAARPGGAAVVDFAEGEAPRVEWVALPPSTALGAA